MEVVDVNNAVKKEAPSPDAEETGSIKRNVPIKIAVKKLSAIICVVENVINFFKAVLSI